jgi:hypothetical protein
VKARNSLVTGLISAAAPSRARNPLIFFNVLVCLLAIYD